MKIFVNKFDFIALCQEFNIDPSIVWEDHEIYLVVSTPTDEYKKLKLLLKEWY